MFINIIDKCGAFIWINRLKHTFKDMNLNTLDSLVRFVEIDIFSAQSIFPNMIKIHVKFPFFVKCYFETGSD